MSGGHEHDNHHDHSSSDGKSIDIGITSMIAGFFGMASGTGAIKMYKDGGGGGGEGHDHH